MEMGRVHRFRWRTGPTQGSMSASGGRLADQLAPVSVRVAAAYRRYAVASLGFGAARTERICARPGRTDGCRVPRRNVRKT